MNISVPDDLAEQVRARDLPISAICQKALRQAVEADQKKEVIMTDIQAVAERLRGTIDQERWKNWSEGRDLGILWAKSYATADELKQVAGSDRLTFHFSDDIREFYDEVDNNYNEEYADEHTEGFIDGAREIWEAVESLL